MRKLRKGLRSYRPVSFYFSNFPQRELGYYGEAFLDAARTLMRSLRRRRGFSQVAVAPVLFTYRHAIELLMKAIIVRGNRSLDATPADDERLFGRLKHHKLLQLLPDVEQVFAQVGWEWFWPHERVASRCTIHITMRTNIVLDDELVDEAMKLTGVHTKKEIVHLALEELIRSRKKKNLLDLAGQIQFRRGFNHKTARKLRG